MRYSQSNEAVKQIAEFRSVVPEAEWLHGAGLLPSPTDDYAVNVHTPWTGSGETYVLDFSVDHAVGTTRLIAKACIKMCASQVMGDWLVRRAALREAGVPTPYLYAVHGATLLEEYIPYDLRQAWRRADTSTRGAISEATVAVYRTMLEQGFRPIGLHDLRSHEADAVVIDYGSDLGGRNAARRGSLQGGLAEPLNSLVGFKIADEELGIAA